MMADAEAEARSVRVLIVEDEAIIAESIRSLLVRAGQEVVGVFGSEEQAVAWVKAHEPPDLALVDIRIRSEEKNGATEPGLRLAEELWVCDRVPVIFVTAFPQLVTRARASHTGVFGVVGKPFSPEALLAQIYVTLERAKRRP